MKLQSLAIIFIIIIMPISIVLSEYVNTKIIAGKTELVYDTRLLNSTHDAIKAYQLNTINNAFGDFSTKKVKDISAAANTFFYSLSSSFNYTGYKSDVMKEYVPAIAFILYDGYYIYSPFENKLDKIAEEKIDKNYIAGNLKPYVSYSCRYKKGASDFIITYTMDNYITIQGNVSGEYVNRSGYLYSIDHTNDQKGLYKRNNSYFYNGVEFKEGSKEYLKEFIGNDTYEYTYIKVQGRKYYLEKDNDRVFYIHPDGDKVYVQENVDAYKKALTEGNKSAYEYYKNAYEFSDYVLHATNNGVRKLDLGNLKVSDAYDWKYGDSNKDVANLKKYYGEGSTGDIYIFNDANYYIEDGNSNFNTHRKAIIRYTVETNLMTAISSFASNAKDAGTFVMPKISETDWDIIENNVCAVSFMQGMILGGKRYNGYAVVANTLTNEYVDEDDIYILAEDNNGKNIYCKANDEGLLGNYKIKDNLTYYPGVWKMSFEQKPDLISESGSKIYYIPLTGYSGSYTSVYGNPVRNGEGNNMNIYSYIKNLKTDAGHSKERDLKVAYYTALARERWGSYHIYNKDNYFTEAYK